MKFITRFSQSILHELRFQGRKGPDLSSATGDLFILKTAPIAGIRLKVPVEEYLGKVPSRADIVPNQDSMFPVIITGTCRCATERP